MTSLKNFVESSIFRIIVFAVILLNAILLGVQCSSQWSENVETFISRGLDFCLVFFVVETILKIVALRKNYFNSRWNRFDFAIVLISVIAEHSGIFSIRILRLIRSVLTLKIFSGSQNIQQDISAILESTPRIFWTMILLSIFFYIFSIAGVSFFGELFPEQFGDLGKSMLSLFQVATLDSWHDINLPVIKRYPFAVFYFIPFIVISSFILLNVVVGIIVDATSSVARVRKLQSDTIRATKFIQIRGSIKAELEESFKGSIKAFFYRDVLAVDLVNKKGVPFIDIAAKDGKCYLTLAIRNNRQHEVSMNQYAKELSRPLNVQGRIVLDACELRENTITISAHAWVKKILELEL